MTDHPAAIVAQVVDVCNDRQHKGFIKITAHVPVEDGLLVTTVLGWPTYPKPVPIVIALYDIRNGKKEEPANTETTSTSPSPSQPPPAGGINKRTQLAGMLCKDPLFQKYVLIMNGSMDHPAEYIRNQCDVKSRKDILPGTVAADLFDDLYDAYRLWRDAPELQES